MSASSNARILYVEPRHRGRRWIVAGTLSAVAAALWMPWGEQSDQGPRGAARPPVERSFSAPPSEAETTARARARPQGAPDRGREAAPGVAPAIVMPAPARPRAAVDSGREQPVFLGIAGPPAARVGQAFTLHVTAESENDVAGGALVLDFDPARLKFSAVRVGQFMAQAGAAVRVGYVVDPRIGRLTIQIAEDAGGPPVSGGGNLLDIDFVAAGPGTTTVTLSAAVLHDLNDEGVTASTLPAHVLTLGD